MLPRPESRMNLARCRVVVAVAAAVALMSCESESDLDSTSSSAIRRDSAGVSIVESLAPAWARGLEWRLDSVPELVIGSTPDLGQDTGAGATLDVDTLPLERIQGLAVLSAGKIAVADGGSLRVMVFDSLGGLVTRFGGRGGGPGEFEEIFSVHVCAADSIVVVSSRHIRVFDDQGRFARQAQYWAPFEGRSLAAVSSDCSRLLITTRGSEPPLNEAGPAETLFTWSDPVTGSADTILRADISDIWIRQLYGAAGGFNVPWGTLPQTHAVRGDALVLGHGRLPELRTYEPAGQLSSVIRWSQQPAPVTDQDRELYSRVRLEWLAGMPEDPETPYWFPALDEYPWLPAQKPLYDRVLVDDEGGVWVRDFPAGSLGQFDTRIPDRLRVRQTWTVFDSTGAWLGSLLLPDRFDLKAVASGRVLGVAYDSLDVQRVQSFRIIKRPGTQRPPAT